MVPDISQVLNGTFLKIPPRERNIEKISINPYTQWKMEYFANSHQLQQNPLLHFTKF